jgi:hypothetical protein
MTQSIYLEPDKVPQVIRGRYAGRKFQAVIGETMHIPATAGMWEGGSRETYHGLRLADGADVSLSDGDAAWAGKQADRTMTLEPGIVVIRSSVFQGRDMGLTIFMHPATAAPLLPAPIDDITEVEQLVLNYTAHRKSSYGGKDRYEMMVDDRAPWRSWSDKAGQPVPTREEWNAAKVTLAERGLLNKAGAITPAGRNAAKRI